ncbi:hypothetical protein [Serratia marcescens]|uniref:hypothetical protein n=1 Tax=Serratia TaxID=613 RepID=UPI0013DC2822|nr:hypothetical protein [Serratia marcescens]EIM8482242.1 hypothetical protein [Serratia marcescens]EIM8487980.1 hypothetical protein [Serratia marcescens]EIU9512351.1 hypothetical protein [Serratia marcescens]ELE6466000.1 hypothetical protein [Serratia marcescens]HBH7048778.1 hypothetical protein [Serratia marcescens]
MPNYISELINDKTIIGACIGAIFSLIGAFAAYGLNVRLEKRKINSIKKEELFYNHQTLMVIVGEINTYDMKSSSDISSIAKSLEPKKDEAIRKTKLLTNMYFNELDKYYDDLIPQLNNLFWHIQIKGNPGIEEFNSLYEKLSSVSNKILSL